MTQPAKTIIGFNVSKGWARSPPLAVRINRYNPYQLSRATVKHLGVDLEIDEVDRSEQTLRSQILVYTAERQISHRAGFLRSLN